MDSTNIFLMSLVAFVGGVVSFLSPCVLPLVPGYIAQISGVSIDSLKTDARSTRRIVITNSLAFNAGLSMIFLALGAAAGFIGSAFLANPWVRIVGGFVIVLFGLQMMGVLKIGALYRDTRRFSNDKAPGSLGSFALGMAFAAGWTPCIGPILGMILGLAATSGDWQKGLVLSAFYSAGLALPFLVTGLGINKFLSFYTSFRQHLHKVEIVSGVMLIVIGVLIASGYLTRFANSAVATWLPTGRLEQSVTDYAKGNVQNNAVSTVANKNTNYPLAPDVELKTTTGETIRLRDLNGQVVLVNFWATWCGPCRAEIPELNKMQRDLGSQGLKIIGVSWDDTEDLIKDFERETELFAYQIAMGGDSIQQQFGGVRAFPTTFVIDRQGRIRETILGERNRAGFEQVIQPLLAESSPSNTQPTN